MGSVEAAALTLADSWLADGLQAGVEGGDGAVRPLMTPLSMLFSAAVQPATMVGPACTHRQAQVRSEPSWAWASQGMGAQRQV